MLLNSGLGCANPREVVAMKTNLLVSLICLLIASPAWAAKLEISDMVGRIFLVDQAEGKLQGSMEISKDKALSFNGKVAGQELSCEGSLRFLDREQQIRAVLPCTDGESAVIVIYLDKTDVGQFLNYQLASAEIIFAKKKDPSSGNHTIFGGPVDIKKLRCQDLVAQEDGSAN